MRSLSVRLVLSFFALILAPIAFAHDVTITGTQTFASLDGSASDHDGSVNGVFTVNDGNLVVNGVVNCNDDGASPSACPMAFAVSGNMTINSGGALYAENRSGGGTGGAITLTVGGNLALNGTAIVSTASNSSSGSHGGAISATVNGTVTLASGTTIDAGSANGTGGNVTIAAGSAVSVDGNVLSGPSRTILSTRLTGVALANGSGNQVGGAITISSTTFAEPAVLIGTDANIISQGDQNGAGPVTIDGCGVQVRGLVAALSRKDSAAKVAIRSGKDVLIDGRDLGAAGTRQGRVRADAPSGTAINKGIDIFASETIDIFGPGGSLFALTSVPGQHDSKSYGGLIRIISLEDAVNASGNVIDDGHSAAGDTGGTVEISAKGNVNLNTAVIHAEGDFSTNNSNRGGGSISVRSYSGDVIWTNGTGDVRPVGSTSGLPPADQGKIVLTACGTINTTGSTFPVMGTATSPLPETHTGVCSPAAPSLPSGTAPLVTCNTPPVANDTSATVFEDNTVTITLSGTDADGDSLTFSIVSGPSNGFLSAITPTGPTTATVDYTPDPNFNGSDSFVYQANDGNGGTDNATASITILPVNDPPTFTIGPPVTVLEDTGPHTFTNWITAISAGPTVDETSSQTVTFSVTNDNNALFSVQPAVDSSGNLTFTLAANAYGSANISVVAQDNGGIANGGDDTSNAQTSSITVTPVNDEPSFVKGADQTVNEDSGPQTVVGWATAISAGPNESGQTLTFFTSNDNNALFSAQPSVSSTGTLTYTPAANANGSATVTIYLMDDGGIANGGDDTSPSQTFTITVNAVNDAPSFTGGGDVSVNEDSGAYSATWATSISAGPADESGQTLTFNVSNDNNALFASQPAIDSSGNLTFTPATNAFGSATVTVTLSDNGGIANGGVDTSAAQTFTITVNGVNDEPSFTAGGDVTVNEDSGAYSATWATAISAGPNEGSQTLTFNVSNDNNALFASQPAIAADGTLTFTPAANAFGSATVSVYLMDNGGIANGGDDTSPTVTFTITVNSVNDEPSFTGGGDVTVNEDSGAYSAAWATSISAGPANESSQVLTFNIVSNSNPSLFASGPSISSTGVLSFTPAANAFGSATIVINLTDDGGIANGGDDTSASYTFTITVNAVNDAPSFTPGGDVTVNEDSGPYSAPWATSISPGPANESGQTVMFLVSNNNNALFLVQPSISPSGVLSFTPNLNANGSATVTVALQDNGGIANGGVDTSASVQFTITVTAVNDGPTAAADAWDTLGNTELRVDFAGGLTPKIVDTTTSGNGVADNDSDPEGDPFIITGIVGCSDVTAPFDCTLGDGSKVSMLANGSFSYTPGPGNTTGSFQYTLTDIPTLGSPASSTGTVTITIFDMIWYVNGTAVAGGNGTSIAPFQNFVSLNGPGGVGDVDNPGATIFVHTSAVTGSITLESNQKLWGEGVGLATTHNLNGNGSPQVLVAPGIKPTVVSGTDTVTVLEVAGVDIAGLDLQSTGGNAIDVTSFGASPATGATIHDNVISAAAAEGIDVNANSASGTTALVTNTSITSVGNGFDVTNGGGSAIVSYTNGTITSTAGSGIRMDGTGGNLTVTGLGNVTISGNTAANGISITAAKFDAIAGGSFDTVNGGTIAVGASGNPVGAAGIVMSSVSGDYAIGSLTVFGGTSGVTIGGTGLFTGAAGMRVSNTGGSISAPAGVGLSVTNATIAAAGLNFTSVAAANAVNGIVLNNTGAGGLTINGDGSLARNGSGGTIDNMSGDAVQLVNANNVTLRSMNITDTGSAPASSAAAQSSAGNHTIDMSGGANLVLSGVLIDNPRGTGVLVLNVAGTNRINSNSLITNLTASAGHGVYVNNVNTNMTLFEVNNSQMTNNAASFTNLFFTNTGTSNMRLDVVNGCVFENLATQAVTAAAGGVGPTTGTLTTNIGGALAINGNTFRNGAGGGAGENNVGILVNNGAAHAALVQNNIFDNVAESGTIANTSIIRTQNNGGAMDAVVKANTIQNIHYAIGGRHAIGHVFEPLAFSAANNSNVEISDNTVTGVTFTGTNRELIFIDYRPSASGGNVKILNNFATFTNAGNQQAMELRFRQTNASTVNLRVDANDVTQNTTAPFVDIDAEAAATVNSTLISNSFTNPSATPGQMIDVATEAATATACANISGNTLSPGSITVNEILGTLNVTQASSAALAAANGGAVVTVGGTPAFGQPVCTLP